MTKHHPTRLHTHTRPLPSHQRPNLTPHRPHSQRTPTHTHTRNDNDNDNYASLPTTTTMLPTPAEPSSLSHSLPPCLPRTAFRRDADTWRSRPKLTLAADPVPGTPSCRHLPPLAPRTRGPPDHRTASPPLCGCILKKRGARAFGPRMPSYYRPAFSRLSLLARALRVLTCRCPRACMARRSLPTACWDFPPG